MRYLAAAPTDDLALATLHTLSWRRNYRGIVPDSLLDGPLDEEQLAVWRERLASAHPERQLILLAQNGGVLQGFVSVLLDQEPAWGARLENLHVHPEAKGRGTGRELLSRARAWVEAVTPGNRMHLLVLAGNRPAIAFYEHLGGQATERRVWRLPSGEELPEIRFVWPALPASPG